MPITHPENLPFAKLISFLFYALFSISCPSLGFCSAAAKVTYTPQSFVINGKPTFIFSGAIHYFRVPKALWEDRLLKMKQAGLNTVETYVAWNYHEPEEGKVNLRELEDFIKLAERMGFYIIARPGPYICAEWDAGGYPAWLIAKGAPLRSNHPVHRQYTEKWYSKVLPLLAKHQLHKSGRIIMVQLENEYDYCTEVKSEERAEFLAFLYQVAKKYGIEVPLITCWTKSARPHKDIMDTVNLYPKGNWAHVRTSLSELRKDQPDAPLMVSELEGGWFSTFGGKLPQEQGGLDWREINGLTKLVLALGVTSANYYMFHGGTNFGYWGAKNLTTTYDYSAPLAEPGGLPEKYYVVKSIGQFLKSFGHLLAQAEPPPDPNLIRVGKHKVITAERVSGDFFMLFALENKGEKKDINLKYYDPVSKTVQIIPKNGAVTLSPREAKLLVGNVQLGKNAVLLYSTAEILRTYEAFGKTLVVFYGDEGEGETALKLNAKPEIKIHPENSSWELKQSFNDGTLTLNFPFPKEDHYVFLDDLVLVFTSRKRAFRTFDIESKNGSALPLVSTAYLMEKSEWKGKKIAADLQLLSGDRKATLFLPKTPEKVLIDGQPVSFDYRGSVLTFTMFPQSIKIQPLVLVQGKYEKDFYYPLWTVSDTPLPPGSAVVDSESLKPLEQTEFFQNGYFVYSSGFQGKSFTKLHIKNFSYDPKFVYINGQFVKEAANDNGDQTLNISGLVKDGLNNVVLYYEHVGRANIGKWMNEPKGVASLTVSDEEGKNAEEISKYGFVAPGTFGQVEEYFKKDFDDKGGKILPFGNWKEKDPSLSSYDGILWYRMDFETPAYPGWVAPLKLSVSAKKEALIYLNGTLIGRYSDRGPQTDFYLPEPYLAKPGKQNVLAFAVRNAGDDGGLYSATISPYTEYMAKKSRLVIEF